MLEERVPEGRGRVSTATVTVTDTGKRAGSEVVQLYVTDVDCSVDRPAKELKGFQKVFLQPGESRVVSIPITRDMLQYYNADKSQWVAEPGDFILHLGTASDNLPFQLKYHLD